MESEAILILLSKAFIKCFGWDDWGANTQTWGNCVFVSSEVCVIS